MNKLFQEMQTPNRMNTILSLINGVKDPNKLFDQLVKTNPQFAAFIRNNQGKSPEQIAKENGIDFDLIRKFIK